MSALAERSNQFAIYGNDTKTNLQSCLVSSLPGDCARKVLADYMDVAHRVEGSRMTTIPLLLTSTGSVVAAAVNTVARQDRGH